MKKLKYITGAAICMVILASSCTDVKREPGRVYMPDMAYSRAYETYAERDSNIFTTTRNSWGIDDSVKIFYNNEPVAGTVGRQQDYVYHIQKDIVGDTVNYHLAAEVKSPFQFDSSSLKEAERLYLINCGICHGTALNGNGPLYKDGTGPYPAKPATLVGDPKYAAMPEGQMFYSVTYGKNLMGSYASQVTAKQRWQIIAYIKSKQAAAAPKASAASTSTTPSKDSTAKKM